MVSHDLREKSCNITFPILCGGKVAQIQEEGTTKVHVSLGDHLRRPATTFSLLFVICVNICSCNHHQVKKQLDQHRRTSLHLPTTFWAHILMTVSFLPLEVTTVLTCVVVIISFHWRVTIYAHISRQCSLAFVFELYKNGIVLYTFY